jgi:hypothetical protein
MLKLPFRRWLLGPGVTASAWRLAAAATAAYFARTEMVPLHGDSRIWYFVAAFLTGWSLAAIAPTGIINRFADLVGTLAVVLLYWYVSFRIDFLPAYAASGIITALAAAHWLGFPAERLFDLAFGRWLKRDTMAEADARFWREPTNVRELALVGALYIRGYLRSQPAYQPGAPVDDETFDLIPALVAANRAGFFTTGSQPGDDEHDMKAYVTGFADEPTMLALRNLLLDSGLDYRIRRTSAGSDHDNEYSNRRIRWGVDSPSNVESFYGTVCNEQAVEALLDAYQIVIEDPEVGNNARVWRLLEEFAAARNVSFHPDADVPPDGCPVVLYTKRWIIKGADVHPGVWLDQDNHEGARKIGNVQYEGSGTDSRFRVASLSLGSPEENLLIDVGADYIAVDPNTDVILPAWQPDQVAAGADA